MRNIVSVMRSSLIYLPSPSIPKTSYTSRASIMTDKDEEVLRQAGWDKVKENLLSDAKSYPVWRRQFPNAISTKAKIPDYRGQ